ncbi:FUSC family protein [Streptomyces sp. NPDC055722]
MVTNSHPRGGSSITARQDSTVPSRLAKAPGTVLRRLRAVRIPRPWRATTGVVRAVKGLIAALLSWEVATWWLPSQQQYLAVATALLMVNAPTVYRSVTEAVRRVAIRAAGLSLAATVAWLFSFTAGVVVAILMIALIAGGRGRSDNRLQIASTAVLTLTAAAASTVGQVVGLAMVTLTGAAVGIAVNALILPPLHLGTSHASVHNLATAMGSLLEDMGHGLRQRQHVHRAHVWLAQGRRLEEVVVQAQEDVRRGEESLRWNARFSAHAAPAPSSHCEALTALHRVSFAVRGIARTLADSVDDHHTEHGLGQLFLDRYASTLDAAGQAVRSFVGAEEGAAPGGRAARERLRGALEEAGAWHQTMTGLIAQGSLVKPGAWHVYGALVTDLERLLADLDRADLFTAAASAASNGPRADRPRYRALALASVNRPGRGLDDERPWWRRVLRAERSAGTSR